MSLPFTEFKDGDLVFVHTPVSIFKPMSLLSGWVRNQERDAYYEHVCQYFKGFIYTTGAHGFPLWRFGKISPEEYLKDVDYAIGRYKNLTEEQIDIMYKTAELMLNKPYAWWKVLGLDIHASLSFDPVTRGFDSPDKIPFAVYCSESVSLGLQRAHIRPGGKKIGVVSADATTPMLLYNDQDCFIVYPEDAPQLMVV